MVDVALLPDPGVFTGCVNVVVDGADKFGPLSYVLEGGMAVALGAGVRVPFGDTKPRTGTVVGPGDPSIATRGVLEILGPRTNAADITYANVVAARYGVKASVMVARLSPARGLSDAPRPCGPVVRVEANEDPCDNWDELCVDDARWRYLLRAPLIDPAALAAAEAQRLYNDAYDKSLTDGVRAITDKGLPAPGGLGLPQVLVVCPSVELVAAVCAQFSSGAERVDAGARKGAASALRAGTLTVAVVTRAGATYTAPGLVGIVIVEEGHPGHVEARSPHTNARAVAEERAHIQGLALSVIGTFPTTAALGENVAVLAAGSPEEGWPDTTLVDRTAVATYDRDVPPELFRIIDDTVRAGASPTVVVESRPAARLCGGCSVRRACGRCSRSGCTHVESRSCACGATRVFWAGWDAQRVSSMFGPRVSVATFSDLVAAITAAGGVGDLGTVVILDIDPALRFPALDANAGAARLVLLAAAAAGPGGHLVVGTSLPNHPLLVDLLVTCDPYQPAMRALINAAEVGLAPYGHLVNIIVARDTAPATGTWPGRILGPQRLTDGTWRVLVIATPDEVDDLAKRLAILTRRGKATVTWTSTGRA